MSNNFPSINAEPSEQVTRRYKGQFASLKFPKRQYHEYPKVIKDLAGKKLGRATNAMEEQALLEGAGLDAQKVDPVAAMQAELEVAKRKLAQYEGKDPANQIAAKKPGARTASVEMLPEEVKEPAAKEEDPPKASGNPLLKAAGLPGPAGTAPKIDTPLKPGI